MAEYPDIDDAEPFFELTYRPPYDWTSALAFLGARALSPVEHVEHGTWVRRVRDGNGTAVLRVAPAPGTQALGVRIHGDQAHRRQALLDTVRRVFDLDADPEAIRAHLDADALMRPRLRKRPGVRVLRGLTPFETAVRAVVGQQISVAGARTVCERIVHACGDGPFDEAPHYCFPDAARLASTDLEGLGLTRTRALTLHRLAEAVTRGEVTLDPDEDTQTSRARLLAVKGIGPWTADYVAMRGLAEPDGFPAGDLGLKRATGLDEKALRARAEAWRPWRAYAAALLWLVDGPAAGEEEEDP